MYLIQGNYKKAIRYCYEKLNGEYFEFKFPYVSEDCRFREIDRFLYESKNTLRFENEYIGNIVVDLSEWNKKKTNIYFEAFMYFLEDNSKKYNCIFIMDKKCDDELFKNIKEFFDIEEIRLDLPETKKKVKIGFDIDVQNGKENTNVRG
ncbi:MAG: hypothetical protein ACI4W6_07560 [Acutalibacteraceae bacterium]